MKVLSFDCGHESLGVCLLEFTPIPIAISDTLMNTVRALLSLDKLSPVEQKILIHHVLSQLRHITSPVNHMIQIHYLASIQLVSHVRSTGLIGRALALKSFLESFRRYYESRLVIPDVVLIEDQTINNLSGEVAAQVAFFYSTTAGKPNVYPDHQNIPTIPSTKQITIVLMPPTLKNLIKFDDDLGIEHFYSKYVSLYEANKNHTKANFLHYMKIIQPPPDWEEYTCSYKKKANVGIPAKRKRDIADSFMQAIAYIKKCQANTPVSQVCIRQLTSL